MIPEQEAWNIRDSSKLTDWLTCPRYYFFTHVLGWQVDQPKHDLYFGECWHRVREYQLIHGYEDTGGAYMAFIEHYRKEFEADTDDMYRPKDPVGVMMAINKLADQAQDELYDNEVLYTEVSGTVPVDMEGRVLHYRMDSILRRKSDGKIFSWDHKSAKRFSRQWSEKFFLSVQAGTYTHCLYCLYPVEKVLGVEFYGTCFEYLIKGSKARPQGYHISFLQVPAWKSPDQMNVWLWNVLDMLDNIDREHDRLTHCSEDDLVMQCFPMNVESCTKYYGCQFHDYCISWPNPLQRCDEPPIGFRTEFWDPRTMDTTNKMNLEWK